MEKTRYYGIWNTSKKEFQFGIIETSKRKAERALFKRIGRDAYKWRFVVKELKRGNPKAKPLLNLLDNNPENIPQPIGDMLDLFYANKHLSDKLKK